MHQDAPSGWVGAAGSVRIQSAVLYVLPDACGEPVVEQLPGRALPVLIAVNVAALGWAQRYAVSPLVWQELCAVKAAG